MLRAQIWVKLIQAQSRQQWIQKWPDPELSSGGPDSRAVVAFKLQSVQLQHTTWASPRHRRIFCTLFTILDKYIGSLMIDELLLQAS